MPEETPRPADLIARVSSVVARMKAFVNAKPGGQQTRTKSAREMVEYFVSELEAALAAGGPRVEKEGRDVIGNVCNQVADGLCFHVWRGGRCQCGALPPFHDGCVSSVPLALPAEGRPEDRS